MQLSVGVQRLERSPAVLWRTVLGSVLVADFAVVLALTLDLSQVKAAFGVLPDHPWTVGLMVAGYTAAFWLRAVAWQLLLTSRPGAWRLFSILQTSLFLNHALPFRAGEFARPYLATKHGVPAAEAATTTVLARLGDFAALAAIAAIAIPLGVIPVAAAVPVAGFAVVIGAVGAGLLLLRSSVPSFTPAALRDKVGAVQTALQRVEPARLALAGPVVVASWLLESCVLYGTASLLGADLSIGTAMGATAVTILFQVVHLTPGDSASMRRA
ncbi:MAG TPA: lysylphosphatidylglycerol synthase transmembrane domain-containing protein [Dehalococcoidia bacterium]|nr:lysylphosphatidylglycerol synthase transmembrane domain-containing protein [Dehalococcoidia bacterium]